MRVLLIDDLRVPSQIVKTFNSANGKAVAMYSDDEVTIARTYTDGIRQLTDNGPWETLLLDNDLGSNKQGKDVLAYLEEFTNLLPQTIILVTANTAAGTLMYEGLRRLHERDLIKHYDWRR